MGRHVVVAALFMLSLITYVDRAAISSAKGAIASELALSDREMGAVFSAFALGYALAQIPAGWFADKVGPRLALATIVTLWSLFTAMTGAVDRFWTLLTVRLLFGVAEAGAFPGSARAFYSWLPPGERGLANGALFSGGLLGGALAFPFFAWLFEAYGWRGAFYALSVPGLVWAILWYLSFRDHPPSPLPEEPAAATPAPLGLLLRSRGMPLVMFQYFAGNFTFFICISWMYPFLVDRYGLSAAQAARYAMVPLLCGATANWVAGFLVDLLYRSALRRWARRLPAMFGFSLATTGVWLASRAGSAEEAVAAFALATFGVELTISPSWAYCLDVGGRRSGSLSGAMNMAGNLGAFASANAFPYLRELTGTTDTYFQTAAVLNAASVACWLWLRPRPAEPASSRNQ